MLKFCKSRFVGDVNFLDYGGVWVSNQSESGLFYIREIINCEDQGIYSDFKYIVHASSVFITLGKTEIKDVCEYMDLDWDKASDWE